MSFRAHVPRNGVELQHTEDMDADGTVSFSPSGANEEEEEVLAVVEPRSVREQQQRSRPGLLPLLSMDGDRLFWSHLVEADRYDVTRFSLTGVGISSLTDAVDNSPLYDSVNATAEEPAIPSAGTGYGYLARGSNDQGTGTYGSDGPAETGDRDGDTGGSTDACP